MSSRLTIPRRARFAALMAPIFALGLSATTPIHGATPKDAKAGSGKPDKADDSRADASKRYRRGVALYKAGDHRAALIEFRRAYEIKPHYRVLYNIGQASFELKDYVGARRAFSRYLQEGSRQLTAERRAAVGRELERLNDYVASLRLVIVPKGVEVTVDDIAMGTTPLAEPLLVSAGRRKIGLSRPGYAPIQRYIDIAGGDEEVLKLELSPLTSAAATPASTTDRAASHPPPATEPTSPNYVPFAIAAGVTGAFGIGAAVVGAMALGAKSDHDANLESFPTNRATIDDSASKVKTLAAVTDALLVATAVGATISIVILTTTGSGERPDASAVQLRATLSAGAFGLSGAF